MHETSTTIQVASLPLIGRYNVCSVACKAYTKGLSQANLQAAFRKSGIHPFNPSEIDVTVFETNQLRQKFKNEHGTTDVVTETPEQTEHIAEHPVVGEDSSVMSVQLIDTCDSPAPVHIEPTPPPQTNTPITTDTFFKKKRPVFVPPVLKERQSISKVVAGKAITEVDVTIRLQQYFSESQTKKSKFQPPLKSPGTTIRHTTDKYTVNNPKKRVNPVRTSESPKPGPSGVQTHAHVIQDSASDSDESEYNPKDLCCVCGNNFPDALNQLPYAEFATWGKCDFVSCAHWVHLKYCCPVRILRRHSTFYCPCHGLPWTGSEE